MFPTDSREGWPADLLTDTRVRHFWDESKLVGQWYGENVTEKTPGHVEWDAYFLYGAAADFREQSALISRGRTIVATRSELQANLASLLEE